jgi:hypothetical protein
MYLGTVIEIIGINIVMYTASVIAGIGAFVSLSLPAIQAHPSSIYKTVSTISIGELLVLFNLYTYLILNINN